MLTKEQREWLVALASNKPPIGLVGEESADAVDDQPASAPASADATAGAPAPRVAPPPQLGQATLEKAPEVWHSTRAVMDSSINALKQAVRDEFAGGSPALLAGIEQTVAKLDVVLERLDHKLADSLAKAHAANDAAARQAELKNSKVILADYINYVKSEPLIAHIDANPLGIQTNLKLVLTDSLAQMAKAIG